jgi:hypothetical protein
LIIHAAKIKYNLAMKTETEYRISDLF